MECEGCGKSDATLTRVKYTTGDVEKIPLCEDCGSEFLEGGLVEEITRIDQ